MTILLYNGYVYMPSHDAPLDPWNVYDACIWCCDESPDPDSIWFYNWDPDYSGEDDLLYHIWIDHDVQHLEMS